MHRQMKSSKFILLINLALLLLLALQGFWLINTYRLKEKQIEKAANAVFWDALKQEMLLREAAREAQVAEQKANGTFTPDYYEQTLSMEEFLEKTGETGLMRQHLSLEQTVLDLRGHPFDIGVLDSLFTAQFMAQRIDTKAVFHLTDSLGQLVQSTGDVGQYHFATPNIYLLKGQRVQGFVDIAPRVVFRQMRGILWFSLAVVAFIIFLFIHEIRIYQSQRRNEWLRESFTNALTHTMKTPLNTIYTVLDRFRKGALQEHPEMEEQFSRIAMQETQGLLRVINQLLTVSTLDKKQLILAKQEIHLPKLIGLLLNQFSVNEKKEILFTEQYGDNAETVYADEQYLTNALSNLFDNAMKYGSEPIHIHITSYQENGFIHLAIRDNGWGISRKEGQKIFNRFERGAETKRRMVSGFGLGLTYVKQVIEAHGGTVVLQSRERQGTTVTMALPAQELFHHIEQERAV